MVMKKIFLTAGIVIIIGIIILAVSAIMGYSEAGKYIDAMEIGAVADMADAARNGETYNLMGNFGLLVGFLGIALLAFGFAMKKGSDAKPT